MKKPSDAFIEDYYYKEIKNADTNPAAFRQAKEKWEKETNMDCPYSGHESIRKRISRKRRR